MFLTLLRRQASLASWTCSQHLPRALGQPAAPEPSSACSSSHDRASCSTSASTPASTSASPGSTPHYSQPQQPHLVEQYLRPELMSKRQRQALRKADVIRSFQRFEGDVGSSEVQIALLTEGIRDLNEHVQAHKKDFHNAKGLMAMLNRRRKLLAYLRRTDFDRFSFVIHKLGLRDNNYAKQARYDKYKVGTRLGLPADPIKRYGFR